MEKYSIYFWIVSMSADKLTVDLMQYHLKIQEEFLRELDKLILKGIWECKCLRITNAVLKENKVEKIIPQIKCIIALHY